MSRWPIQLLRYGVVGTVSNGILYLGYLLATGFGADPKLAMTLLFLIGVLGTFFGNRDWSFQFRGASTGAFARYWGLYGAAYLVNLVALVVLVDGLGLSHQWVQGGAVLALAIGLFLGQKFWVFCSPRQGSCSQEGNRNETGR